MPIKILHSELSPNLGGIESFLYAVYQHIDRCAIQFDFITTSDQPALRDQFDHLHANIYQLPSYVKNPAGYLSQLSALIKEQNYTAVHIHKNSAANILPYLACKKANAKTVITHAHNTSSNGGKLTNFVHHLNQRKLTRLTDYGFACSEVAAKWVFGEKYLKTHDVPIIHNGVDLSRLSYDEERRKKSRQMLHLQDQIVVGHIGRFIHQKNHMFVLRIFESFQKLVPNAVLLLVGEGEQMEQVKEEAKRQNIADSIQFLGNRTDVPELLQAMDIFLLPSFYEGLPIACVEAQAAGLPCMLSDTITSEIKMTKLVSQLSLDDSPDVWAEQMQHVLAQKKRTDQAAAITAQGYNIESTVERLMRFYLNLK